MEYELYHWGIKGMKWGVRRYQNKDGSLTRAGKRREKQLAQQRVENLKKARAAKAERKQKLERDRLSPKKMSDQELRDRIARLELEKSYREARNNSQVAIPKVKRFLNKFTDATIDKVAENVAADIIAQTLKAGIVKGINKAFDEKDEDGKLLDVVFTNNKKK